MNDIDLSGFDWNPIGEVDVDAGPITSFTGIFDGNGYSIKNMSATDKEYFGLFGVIDNAEVKNLNMENFSSEGVTLQQIVASPIAIMASNSVISNCTTSGDIKAYVNSSFVGQSAGVVGIILDSTVEYSSSSVNISAGYLGIAGICGGAINTDINSCSYTGKIFDSSTGAGIVGVGENLNISNCYTSSNISTAGSMGIVYQLTGTNNSIKNCYVDSDMSLWLPQGASGGGVVGICYADGANLAIDNVIWNTEKTPSGTSAIENYNSTITGQPVGLKTAEMQNPANWSGWDTNIWDFSTYPPTFKMYTPVDASGGGSTGGGDVPIPGAVRLQIGSDSSSTSAIYVDTSFDLGAFDVDFLSADSCAAAIEDIDEVLSRINTKRSEFGAVINRLSSILESQTTTIQNFTSAQSTIMDADIANESADFVKNQILQQTSSALLAQSQNLHASIVLSLIG